MSKRAWTYIVILIAAGTGVYVSAWVNFSRYGYPTPTLWLTFICLTILMAAAQMFRSEASTHEIYHPNLMFAFAGVLLLPPYLFGTMIIVSHLVEWGKERIVGSEYLKSWYLQPFNIGMHILIGGVTFSIFDVLRRYLAADRGFAFLLVAMLSAAIYLLLNHFLVGSALVLARRVNWRDSGILDREALGIDYAMLAMGITVYAMVEVNLWLIIPAMAPLYLIYRALAIPKLKRQASSDLKTGLWNAEYFRKTLEIEMARGLRFNRPLVVIMADLDLLRNINNVYGHLGGDAVLIGVAEILKRNLRDFDTIARFGGEEFAIIMPEITPEQAYARVERVRRQIEQTVFIAPISSHKIKATMSFGITGLASTDRATIDIIHRADLAVYAAKIRGRNQTCLSDYAEGVQISLEERISV